MLQLARVRVIIVDESIVTKKGGVNLAVKKNLRIRKLVSDAGMYLWELADAVGVSPTTLSTWLRHTLTPDKEQRILNAIDKLNRRNAKREAVMVDA